MKRRWELCPKIGSEVCAHILFTVYRIHAHDESEERTKERVRERSRVSEESASVWECTRALYHRVRTMRVQLRIQSQPYWMNLVRALNLSSPFNSIFVPIFTKWKIRPGSHACPVLWISCACFQFSVLVRFVFLTLIFCLIYSNITSSENSVVLNFIRTNPRKAKNGFEIVEAWAHGRKKKTHIRTHLTWENLWCNFSAETPFSHFSWATLLALRCIVTGVEIF